jgi:type II secretory pathway pseudopilin PulG
MSARGEGGFSLVAAMAAITIMLILMGAAVPSWRYVMKDMREEELLFRGQQIANAVQAYRAKHGAPPAKIEDLVKQKFLRKNWDDPVTGGKWHLIGPGEAGMGARGVPRPGAGSTRPEGRGGLGAERREGTIGGRLGVFVGVSSTSEDDSLRIVNGKDKYNEWLFIAGNPPPVIGKQRGLFGVPNNPGSVFPGGPKLQSPSSPQQTPAPQQQPQ